MNGFHAQTLQMDLPLGWTGFGGSWDIGGILISATNSGDLYVYEDEWLQIENPTEYAEWRKDVFKDGVLFWRVSEPFSGRMDR